MAQPMEVEGAAGAAAGAADERAKGDWIDAEPESQSKERSPFTELSEWRYLLRQPAPLVPAEEKAAVRARLMARVEKDSMAAYYRFVAADAAAGVQLDEELARRMEERNAAELAALEAAIEKAKKESGSTEVRDAYMARSDFLARTAAREVAAKSYEETLGRTVGSGAKVDVEFAVVRLGMLYADLALVRKHLDAAGELVESGADWEQRNLFKVYRATYLMTVRSFREASRLMLDSLATFTCTELFDYTTFVFYAAVVATASVDRTTLRDKVLSSAEVLSSYHEIPHLQAFLESLHRCRYAEFLRALQELVPRIRRDQYMGPHFPFLLREIRVVLYRQYLQAYRSVRLASMAETFGLSVDFVDRELSRFIAAGRLSCKIDKVNGVVESVRPDSKNSQYLDTIKQGDLLLNRIQKLTKLTNV